jgi:hypothetical protein
MENEGIQKRKINTGVTPSNSNEIEKNENPYSGNDDGKGFMTLFISLLFCIFFIPLLLILFVNVYPKYFKKNDIVPNKPVFQNQIEISSRELLEFNGKDPNKPIYLGILFLIKAINGIIYDVSEGRKHYGPGITFFFINSRRKL